MASSREAFDCFLDTARDGDEIALATFASGQTEIDVPLSRDAAPLREAMELWEPYGTTGLYDAVAMLPEISMDGGGAKRAAVLVTDGVDNASAITPQAAQKLVQAADLPVYVLALPGREEGAPAPIVPLWRPAAPARRGDRRPLLRARRHRRGAAHLRRHPRRAAPPVRARLHRERQRPCRATTRSASS